MAPRSTAWAACRWPSVWAPGTQQKSDPCTHLAAVELDRSHIRGCRVSTDTDHADVADQCGHQHEREFQGLRMGGGVERRRSEPTYGPSVVAPDGTETVPVAPMAAFEASAVAAAVVGMP